VEREGKEEWMVDCVARRESTGIKEEDNDREEGWARE
jgi:hypothetical protein